MKKVILILSLLLIVACSYIQKNPEGKCCIECQEEFSQSPIGVGEQAAKCGEFTTTKELSNKCKEFFSQNPKTVKECSGWNTK